MNSCCYPVCMENGECKHPSKGRTGSTISDFFAYLSLYFYRAVHWFFLEYTPEWYNWPTITVIDPPLHTGFIPLLAHRAYLNRSSLYPHPGQPSTKFQQVADPIIRTGDGYGTDVYNPSTGATGQPFGRNVRAIPLEKRNPLADPSPQLVAQRLLARDTFKPAGMQLNILAAAWIQAMVHDWLGHFDDPDCTVTLSDGAAHGCPMHSFTFRESKKRPNDDAFNSFRSHWWDASFLYGQTDEQVARARAYKGGLLKVNETHPMTLPREEVTLTGDRKDAWLGISLLQELFLREHNLIATAIAKNHPELAGDDEKLYGMSRNVVAAMVAKIHTIDWTCELLKHPAIRIAMWGNWGGGHFSHPTWPTWFPQTFHKVGRKKTDNKGVPFSLTEEFVAVYRLHPLIPDDFIVHQRGGGQQVLPLSEFIGEPGEKLLRENQDRPLELWDCMLRYPCGNLECHNFPRHLRKVPETDFEGRPVHEDVDLAAIDIYRDRERGIAFFNDFRESLGLRRYKDYMHLTGGDAKIASELEEVYGPNNVDKLDLLVGNMAEAKIPGFAISETSFVIFIVMATRRLETDPFLNTYLDEEHYSATGLKWLEDTMSLRDIIARHYPQLVEEIPENMSAFTPRTPWPGQLGSFPEEEKKEDIGMHPSERTPLMV